ncbi:MAG: elongation factor EF-2 [Nanohaloarchaea archaeon]|nr:elongation factor EF-2 [Candidatus Nanohaloarchaea archaeon]
MAKMIDKIKGIVDDKSRIRNLCICAHIDHGKTTLSDNLLSGAGMISEELAGRQLATDFDAQEQERGITIYSANVSMVHTIEGTDYLINLIDTPGHVDFGGDVTRAMRAVDGAVVVACAVDGVMPQTETVLRQALKERVKPVLFINKVDRMIKELQLTPEQMNEKFTSIIYKVNEIIRVNAPAEFKQEWQVNVAEGKVGFGSAYKNWAISIPFMQKTGITFKDIIEYTQADNEKELAKKAPLHNIVLDMAIKHLPTPDVAQAYRIPKLWTGDLDTVEGKSMLSCDASGPLAGVVTNVTADKHAGMVATARLFSGTLKDGDSVLLVGAGQECRVQIVSVYNGPKRDAIGSMPCGNIVGITGIGIANSGETICHPDNVVSTFESITHIFEPVVTKSIEVNNVKDLPKVINVLKQRAKEDQTLVVKISEDTGEMLISGLGELHLEAKVERYFKDLKLDVKISAPIVIFKEGVKKLSDEFEGKSPNKHNKFYFKVEPVSAEVIDLLNSGELKSGTIRKQDVTDVSQKLVAAGFDKDVSKKVVYTYQNNMIVNVSRGVQYLNEVMELIKQAFREVCDKGPLADEPCFGLKLLIMDAKLHEDTIHRGPAQVLPAVRGAVKEAMINGDASIFEPKQVLRIDTPTANMGNVMNEVQNRRGQVLNMSEEGDMTVIEAKIPVAEMFGFEASLKSATGGRGFQALIDILYEIMPKDIQQKNILQIRKRKGLKEVVPTQGSYGS